MAAMLLLLLLCVQRCLLPGAQHPQLLQGQAEPWAQGSAPAAESRGKR